MAQVWIIGSAPGCDIQIDNSTVSGQHCRLTCDGSAYQLEDLHSTNGTYVNGQRIRGIQSVDPSDVITLGRMIVLPWPQAPQRRQTAPEQTWSSARVVTANQAQPAMQSTASQTAPGGYQPLPSAKVPPVKAPAAKAPSSAAPPLAAGADDRRRRQTMTLIGSLVCGLCVLLAALAIAFWTGSENTDADAKQLSVFTRHHAGVRCLSVSLDGSLVASADADGKIEIWEAQNRHVRGQLGGQSLSVNCLAISPDGHQAASGGDDSAVHIWDLKKFTEKTSLKGHRQAVTGVVFYPSQTHVVSGGRDGRLLLWDLADEKVVREAAIDAPVTCLALTPDGQRLLSGHSTGSVRLWELSTLRELARLKGHHGSVTSLAVSPLDGRALSCGVDGTLVLWDLENKRAIETWNSPNGHVRALSVAFSPGGTRALSSDADGGVWLWSCEDGQLLESYSGHGGGVPCCAFFPNGVVVMTGSMDSTVRLWSTPPPSQLEIKKIAEAVDGAKHRAEKLERFSKRIDLAKQLLDDGKLNQALAEFNSAATGVDRDTLEYQAAERASKKTRETIAKRDQYRDLCEAGKAAADKKDYEQAVRDFKQAREIFPDRDEARDGYNKALKASELKQALDGADFDSELGFAVNAPSHGAMDKSKVFAFLLVRRDPPMALPNTPIAWTMHVNTPIEFPDEKVTLKVQLSQADTGKPIAEVEHPFVPGTKQQEFLGEAAPPEGGWKAATYEMRTSLMIGERNEPHGEPVKFDIGLLKWEERTITVEPAAVQKANYAIDTGIKAERGDALRVTARGTVAPGPVHFYRELMADRKIAEPVPSKPSGIPWLADDLRLKKYKVVDIKSNYAALLVRVGVQGWIPYRDNIPPQILPASGDIELSINSVIRARLSVSSGMQDLPSTDPTFWQPNSGTYQATIYHGKFDFVEKLPLLARAALLQRFAD